MTVVTLWAELVAIIAVHVAAAETGLSPLDLQTFLRIPCLEQGGGLSDLAAEDALCKITIYRDFVVLSGTDTIPDCVSILRFLLLLEDHDLSPRILRIINTNSAHRASRARAARSLIPPPSLRGAELGARTANATLRCTKSIKAANVIAVTQAQTLLDSEDGIMVADAGY